MLLSSPAPWDTNPFSRQYSCLFGFKLLDIKFLIGCFADVLMRRLSKSLLENRVTFSNYSLHKTQGLFTHRDLKRVRTQCCSRMKGSQWSVICWTMGLRRPPLWCKMPLVKPPCPTLRAAASTLQRKGRMIALSPSHTFNFWCSPWPLSGLWRNGLLLCCCLCSLLSEYNYYQRLCTSQPALPQVLHW